MQHIVEEFTKLALENNGKPIRIIVGVVGVPGSGKTTLAQELNKQVNKACQEALSDPTIELSTVLPMDGFHLLRNALTRRHARVESEEVKNKKLVDTSKYISSLYNTALRDFPSELINTPYQQSLLDGEDMRIDDDLYFIDEKYQQWPNKDLAFAKRGAIWTFDPFLLSYALYNIKYRDNTTQFFPGWDHAKKDPSYDNLIQVKPQISLIIIEGLYLLVNIDPWYTLLHTNTYHEYFKQQNIEYNMNNNKNIEEKENVNISQPNNHQSNGLIDIAMVLNCSEEITTERGAVRNWKAGITNTLEESVIRWQTNDVINGRILMNHMISQDINNDKNGPRQWYVLNQEDVVITPE